ncbi:MAG: SDR family NAD(P)-dependent oxidoreductase, partial [Deltaproteobacteria bacterium]|nr:SDR family NAD(P)-dependent oxidoreductase [Deltaproteobacteria bacterium]
MAEPPRLAPASPGLAPLQGRVALVTGGARRVGAAIVRRLAGAGAAVVIHYQHSRGEAEALLGELQQQGAHGVALAADLRQPSEISWLFSAAPRLLGPVELLVNNAAIFLRQPRAEITVAGWEQVQQVNLRAPFLCIQAAVPQIRGQGGGAIVNIADLAGLQAWPDASAHCAAKAGLVALTRSLALALELAPAIRVNAVAPSL